MKQIDNTLRIKKLMADQELVHTFNPLSSNVVEEFSLELARKHEATSDPEAFLLTEDLRKGEIFHPLFVMYNFQYEGQLPMLEAVNSSDEANEFMEQHLQLRGKGYLKKI
jgi:hypothetical protein